MSVLRTMPRLEIVAFVYLDNERAQLVTNAIIASNTLRKVECGCWDRVDAELIVEIQHYCELNRIGFPQLVEAEPEWNQTGLWPAVLANIRQSSAIFLLLREKNNAFVHAGSGRA